MAGDWIKIERATPHKPEVMLTAQMLEKDRRWVVGLFVDYFAWLDEHVPKSRNGLVTLTSRRSIEETFQCVGFAAVLERIGWAKFDDDKQTMQVINWERHNGSTAKTRALTKDRASRHRNATVTPTSRRERDESVTREEKRRSKSTTVEETPPLSSSHHPRKHPAAESGLNGQNRAHGAWWRSNHGIEAKAKELGLPTIPGEDYGGLKRRCFDEEARRRRA